MKYFYLSFPPKYSIPRCDKCCPSILSVVTELLEKFKIEPYEYGSGLYGYYDRGYKIYSKDKFIKIKKYIKTKHPKVKIVYTNTIDSWK